MGLLHFTNHLHFLLLTGSHCSIRWGLKMKELYTKAPTQWKCDPLDYLTHLGGGDEDGIWDPQCTTLYLETTALDKLTADYCGLPRFVER